MGSSLPPWITQVLSEPRFAGYLAATSGDVDAAVALYRWNVEVSAAFMVPLHWTETALRNALHARLATYFGRNNWWDCQVLDSNGRRKVDDACSAVRRLGRDPSVSDSVVAELSFGFWVSLMSKRYTRTLWVPALHRAFPGQSRRSVHSDFEYVLRLRNRMSHGEPVHARHLHADHTTVCRLLGGLSPVALREATFGDRVPALLGSRGPR